jgi:GNAT superfamily N-acetyltransferase
MIRIAHASEAQAISDLAFRSKSHWEYTPDQLEVFRGELTITPDQVTQKRAHVAEESGAIVGFYTLAALNENEAELEHIFVDPDRLTRGVGSQLFRHACEIARVSGARTLVVQSDPNAAGFYHALGAKLEIDIPSSIPGRTIPYFTYSLARDDAV